MPVEGRHTQDPSVLVARAGERAAYTFTVTPASIDARGATVRAVASTTGGKEYREGFELIDHRDLELRYLYRTATEPSVACRSRRCLGSQSAT